jgi:prepilin-type N-terminal cleavage/methylation domain-containing protein
VKRKKRAFTLLEMMVVIFLIGVIGSVVAYNFKGSLDKGKKFKTKYGAEKLENILNLMLSDAVTVDRLTGTQAILKNELENNQYARNQEEAEKLTVDGWGAPYTITFDGSHINVTSPNIDR